jgi:CheY-like chemotaxis protein
VPHTLLLADDSLTIQRVIELTFADEDIEVTAVSDGEQAIQRLEAAPPDIVLADIGMPGRNGYEVAQYIKRSPRLAHIPVVLLTGAFEPVDQARASEAGCDGVLAKPFEPQLVIGRVKDLLARPRPAAPAAASAEPPALSTETPVATPETAAAAPVSLDSYFDRLDAAFSNLSTPLAPAPVPVRPPAPAPRPVADEIDWFGAAKTETAAPLPELELPAPPAVDERPDLPLSTLTAVPVAEIGAPAAEAPPAPVAEVPYATVAEAPPAPVAEVSSAPIAEAPPAPVAEVPPAPIAEALPAPVAEVSPALIVEAPVAQPAAIAPTPQPPVPIHQVPTLADAFAVLLAAEKGEAPPSSWPVAGPSASLADDVVEQVTRRVLAKLSEPILRETVADVVSSIAERLIREEIERIKAAIQ